MGEKKNPTCPACGAPAICLHQAIESWFKLYDEYILTCPKCGHEESQQKEAGFCFLLCFTWETTCPFCGRSPQEHPRESQFIPAPLEVFEPADPEACPKCGKPVLCRYLGDQGMGKIHNYLWEHRCSSVECDYCANFEEPRFHGDEDDDCQNGDHRFAGKTGGCPGPHKEPSREP